MLAIENKCTQAGTVMSLIKTRLCGMRKTNTVLMADDKSLSEMASLLRQVGADLQHYSAVLERMQAAKNDDTPYALLVLRGLDAQASLPPLPGLMTRPLAAAEVSKRRPRSARSTQGPRALR